MKKLLCLVALAGCATSNAAQAPLSHCPDPVVAPPPAAATAAPVPDAQPMAAAADSGLDELATLTFDCPKAALNAAAREAAKVKSEGSYQFSHFNIVSDSHQSVYEVHFKSNYENEPELRYCIALYCQQGWDPKRTQATVTLMSEQRGAARASADAACGGKHTHAAARRIE